MTQIRVPAEVDSLVLVNSFVEDLALRAGLIPARAYLLRLAVEELVINIASHGYGVSERGEIVIDSAITDTEVWLRLTDTARCFNPFQAAPPSGLERPLQEREPGSLGLYLVNHAVDRAFHEYVAGSNRSTIVIWRVQPAEDGQAKNVQSVRGNTDREQAQPKRRGTGPVADTHGRRSVGRSEFAGRGTGGAVVGRPFV